MNLKEFRKYVVDQGTAVSMSAAAAKELVDDIDQIVEAYQSVPDVYPPGTVVILRNLEGPTMIVNGVCRTDKQTIYCKYWCSESKKFVNESFHVDCLSFVKASD